MIKLIFISCVFAAVFFSNCFTEKTKEGLENSEVFLYII